MDSADDGGTKRLRAPRVFRVIVLFEWQTRLYVWTTKLYKPQNFTRERPSSTGRRFYEFDYQAYRNVQIRFEGKRE